MEDMDEDNKEGADDDADVDIDDECTNEENEDRPDDDDYEAASYSVPSGQQQQEFHTTNLQLSQEAP